MKALFKNEYLFFFTGLFAGLFFIIIPVLGYSFTHFPGDFGDGRLNLYFLEHSFKFLTFQLQDSYWDAPFMYPAEQILTYSDNLLGSAPIYALFRLIDLNIFTSYQWWYLSVSALNYICAYLFFKHTTKSVHGAVFGAMIFAFSLALTSQLAHAQTFPRFGIPLALLFAARFHESVKSKDFFWMSFFVVYQIYCGIYLGFLLLIPTIIFSCFTVYKKHKLLIRNLKTPAWVSKILIGLSINGALLAWLMYPYLMHSKESGGEPYEGVLRTLPTFQSYVLTGNGSLIWDYLSSIGNHIQFKWDFEIFPGAFALVGFLCFFIILLVKKVGKKEVPDMLWGLALTSIITFLLFIRIDGKSLYYIIYILPGFSAMRSMARIINVELIFFGLGVSYITAIFFKVTNYKTFFLFILICGFILIDNYSSYEFSSRRTKLEAQKMYLPLEDCMSKLPSGSVASFEPLELNTNPIYYQITAMLASQKNNIKTINGYSGNSPKGYDGFWHAVDEKSRNYWLLMNNEFPFDTLYVIDDTYETTAYSVNDINNQLENSSEAKYQLNIQQVIKNINNDPKWVENIRVKTKSKGISIDSAIYLDAVWLINKERESQK